MKDDFLNSSFPSGFEDEPLDLMPDYLRNWKGQEVVWKPGETDDDGQVCLWYQLNNGKKIPVAARSELLVVTGPQKSRKTLLLQCMLMSNYIDDTTKTLGFKMDLDMAPVLMFDTEQPIRRTKKNRRRFHEIVGLKENDPNYRIFNIKKYSHSQKMKFITHAIAQVQEEMGVSPGMIIIDQLADLCPARDVNNQEGVNEVLDHLNLWEEMTGSKALIAAVIHTNRGRMNTNGKLGVMLDQKTDCSFHVDIDFDTWISTVTHKEAREMRCPKFTFRQDFSGHPRLLVVDDHELEEHIN
jgi:hypothetical protein